MLPHVNAKNQEQGGLASPGKTKGKTLHTPSPGLVKAIGDLAEELSQRTLKRLQPNLKAVIVERLPGPEGCVYSRKMHFPWEAGPNACCRLGSSALDSKHSAETLLCWICGATENHWRGESLPWTWCKARNMLRVFGLCWRTWGLNIHLIRSPLYQPKAGEITTPEWFCGFCTCWLMSPPTSLLLGIQGPLCSQSCRPQPQSSPRAKATALLTLAGTTADCHTVLIGSQSRTGIRLENSCRFPEIN